MRATIPRGAPHLQLAQPFSCSRINFARARLSCWTGTPKRIFFLGFPRSPTVSPFFRADVTYGVM